MAPLDLQWQAAGEAIIVLGVENVEEMRQLEAKAKGLGICIHPTSSTTKHTQNTRKTHAKHTHTHTHTHK